MKCRSFFDPKTLFLKLIDSLKRQNEVQNRFLVLSNGFQASKRSKIHSEAAKKRFLKRLGGVQCFFYFFANLKKLGSPKFQVGFRLFQTEKHYFCSIQRAAGEFFQLLAPQNQDFLQISRFFLQNLENVPIFFRFQPKKNH